MKQTLAQSLMTHPEFKSLEQTIIPPYIAVFTKITLKDGTEYRSKIGTKILDLDMARQRKQVVNPEQLPEFYKLYALRRTLKRQAIIDKLSIVE